MNEPTMGQRFELISVMTERSLRLWVRFKLSFVFSIISMLVSIVTFFFVSKLVDESSIASLSDYGGNYFSFVLVGLAFLCGTLVVCQHVLHLYWAITFCICVSYATSLSGLVQRVSRLNFRR